MVQSCARLSSKSDGHFDKLEEARRMIPKKYKIFSDEDNDIIPDSIEDLDVILNRKQQRRRPVARRTDKILRGKEGVFDIEELVVLLKQERMHDIAVIKVPEELKYCQHMVVVTCSSPQMIKV